MLTEEGVGRVMTTLREQFDFIVCDSPAGIEQGLCVRCFVFFLFYLYVRPCNIFFLSLSLCVCACASVCPLTLSHSSVCLFRVCLSAGAHQAMFFADDAIMCTNPELSSVRDADKMIGLLTRYWLCLFMLACLLAA